MSFSNWRDLVHIHKDGELAQKIRKLESALMMRDTDLRKEIKSRLEKAVWYFITSASILNRYSKSLD